MLVGTVVSLAIPDIILSMFQADAELMRAGMEALRLISLGFFGVVSRCDLFRCV